jgi:hypothetical protein
MNTRCMPVLAILLSGICAPAHAVTYQTVDLGAWMWVNDVNQAGQVVGTGLDYYGRVWDPHTGLSTLPCESYTYPQGINDSGGVVAVVASTLPNRAIRIDASGAVVPLVSLSGRKTTPSKINNANQAVGGSYNGDYSRRPVLWDTAGSVIDLGVIDAGRDTGQANDINDAGQVVGESSSHAFVWSTSWGLRDLGPGIAVAINSQGSVVVNSADRTSSYVWRDGVGLSPLGQLTGWVTIFGSDINSSGQVVGGAVDATGNRLPVVWNPDGGIVVLPKPSSASPSYGEAVAINNSGWVLGSAYHEGYLWVPVPEPGACSVLLASLAGFGAVIRRRKL